jgi:hypothetical protein
MTITLADTRFSGPYSRFDFLDHRPGVWAVLDGRSLPPIAAGAAEDVHEALGEHPDRDRWGEDCQRPSVAVFYTLQETRRERLLASMRDEYGLRPVQAEEGEAVLLPRESSAPPVPSERPDRERAESGDSGQVRAVS